MKKAFLCICILFLWIPWAFAVEDGQEKVSGQIQEKIKEMIRVGMDREEVSRMVEAMEKNRFQQEHILKAQDIIIKVGQVKLPLEPLVSKIYEGMVKKVPAEAIIGAMEAVHARSAFAYEQAQKMTTRERHSRCLAGIIADALAAGMSDKDIVVVVDQIREQCRRMNTGKEETMLETFLTARDMARLGVRSQETAGLLCQALRCSYRSEDIKAMRKSFIGQCRYAEPGSLAKSYGCQIGKGVRACELDCSGSGADAGKGGLNGSGSEGSAGGGHGGNGGHGGGGHGGR